MSSEEDSSVKWLADALHAEAEASGKTSLHCLVTSFTLNISVVRGALKMPSFATSVNARDKNGNTPFHLVATKCSDYDILAEFLKAGADPNIANNVGETPFSVFCKTGTHDPSTLKLFRDNGAQSTGFDLDKNGETILTSAVKAMNVDLVASLAHGGTSLHTTDSKGMTPLALAVDLACIEKVREVALKMVNILLDAGAGATVNNPNKDGTRILRRAVDKCLPLHLIKRLVDAGANPYLKDSDGETALTMTQLWKNKFTYYETTYYGKNGGRSCRKRAPLPSAWVDVGLALLRSRSEHAQQALAKTFEDDNTTFILAAISSLNCWYNLANAAIQAGADVNAKHYDTRAGPVFGPFRRTTRDVNTGGTIYDSSEHIHPKIEGVFTPFAYFLDRICVSRSISVTTESIDLIERFIEKGAVLTRKEQSKYFDLMLSMDTKHHLIRKMISLMVVCSSLSPVGNGCTLSPLMLACKKSDVDVVALLLTRGVDTNIRDSKGQTALFYAVKCSKAVKIVQMLVDAGADVSVVDNSGATALMGAAGSDDAVKAIIESA